MKPKQIRLLIILLVVVILAALAYIDLRYMGQKAPMGKSVTYYCASGLSLEATYSSNKVSLALSDGRTLSLSQKRSGSGVRYESTAKGKDAVFIGEGKNVFLMEGGATTYRSCTAADISASDAPGYALYTDPNGLFTFAFPTDFTPAGTEPGYIVGWSADSIKSGMILAKVEVPKNYEPGTNFVDARFTVGTSVDPDAVKQCLLSQWKGMSATPAAIAEVSFTKLVSSDAGAGNFYETTSYRTLKDNQCYAIEYTIHYSNLANYPKGSVQAFDKAKVVNALDEMAQSFRFLQ